MRSLPFVLLLAAAACGEVKHPGQDDGGGSTESCTPGDALACQGQDLLICAEDGETREVVVCDISCDTDELACTCEPGTQSCADDIASVCGDNGLATLEPCALGCFDDTRCAELDASNRLTQFLDEAASGPDLVLTDGTIIDTNDQEIIVDGLPINVTPVLLEAPPDEGGIPVLVFAVSSLTVTGDVIAEGQPALAFVSAGDIAITGVVRSLAGPGPNGTGDGEGFVVCQPDPAMAHISGMGGGGFASRGGKGGDISGGPTGGAGGPVVGNEEIVPLRGGGNNVSVAQVGGGGLQLVSRTRIALTDGGTINAGGKGGGLRGGGGAGGGILLEAPVVILSGAASALGANGGAGGCGGDAASPAEDGRLDNQRAAGCVSADANGSGGNGGAGDAMPNGTAGQTISGCGVAAGAGGGGVGRIRVNTADGTFTPADGAVVTPSATSGPVGTR